MVDPDAPGVGSCHVMFMLRPLNPWILVGPTRHSRLTMLVCTAFQTQRVLARLGPTQ